MGFFEKFKNGLNKSASSLSEGIKNLVIKKEIDDKTLNEIEEFLIICDVGIEVAKDIRNTISQTKILPDQDSITQVKQILEKYIKDLMLPLEKEILINDNNHPKVFLIAGVNGAGKTTTIGKLGKILKNNNKKIVFAAADTFRAAAIEQLEKWSTKVNVNLIKSEIGSDPASVAFKAVNFAKQNNFDYVLIYKKKSNRYCINRHSWSFTK